MLKLLITGAIVYFIYRFFIAPPAVDERSSYQDQSRNSANTSNHDDEYVDYEEVD